jgi:hypothetical protein
LRTAVAWLSSARFIRLNLTITDPQDAYLTAEAAKLGISISELIRRILDAHRTANEQPPNGEGNANA